MKNQEIISEIEAAEKHLADLKNKLNAKKPDLEGAEKWLKDYISKPFEVVHDLENERINYFRDRKTVFQQDLKNGDFWFNYSSIYAVLRNEYNSLENVDIHGLIKNVVQKAFDCQGLTPEIWNCHTH